MNEFKYSIAWKGKLYRFSNSNKEVLINEVTLFLRKNNINFNSVDLVTAIDRQSKIAKKKNRIGLADAVAGANAIIQYVGGAAASNEEIQRRSEICKDCSLITPLGGCAPCGAAGKMANFVSNLRTKLKLQEPIPPSVKSSFCEACDCSLALMVVSRIEAFKESTEKNSKRPDNCWVKKTSTNYIA